MTDPVSTPAQVAGGSSLIGLYTALFGVEYGQDIAVITAGVFGAFFALASSVPRDSLRITQPTSIATQSSFLQTLARIFHVHTPYHRAAWVSLVRGGTFAGLTANLVAKNLVVYVPAKAQVSTPDILLVTALLIGGLADKIIPWVRKIGDKITGKFGKEKPNAEEA